MHSSTFDTERDCLRDGGEVLVAIAALVTEGRIPGKINKSRGFFEGPHCPSAKNFSPSNHSCNPTDNVCKDYEKIRSQVLNLWRKNIPVCVEVFLTAACSCEKSEFSQGSRLDSIEDDLLLERWYFSITHHRTIDATTPFNFHQLINAVRSQLYFSQISAWLSSQEESSGAKLSTKNFKYRLAVPGETYECSNFTAAISKHAFPNTDLGNGLTLNITLLSLNRMSDIPKIKCLKCEKAKPLQQQQQQQENAEPSLLFDDRMHTNCTLKGKHRCEDLDDFDSNTKKECKVAKSKRVCHKSNNFRGGGPEPSTSSNHKPKLQLDIAKAELHREMKKKNFEQLGGPNLKQKLDLDLSQKEMSALRSKYDLNKDVVLLSAILRNGRRIQNDDGSQNDKQKSTNVIRGGVNAKCDETCVQKLGGPRLLNGWTTKVLESECDNSTCDKACERGGDISNNCKEKINIYVDSNCDSPVPKHSGKFKKMRDISNLQNAYKGKARQRITFEDFPEIDEKIVKNDKVSTNINAEVPSPLEQAKFRKSLDNAASMVFHSRTGLPLTSSPAPVRKGKCFDFDSSINSVSAIKSALFSGNLSTDDDSESDGSIVSPCSPDTYILPQREPLPAKYCRKGHAANLLGTFEESVLNGRLEPVSTVHGFTAELGASGSFVPRHLIVPVTVFFYTLGDNDKVSSPYLGHINLGRKGYNVPKMGTVQVTLFNPLGTVVKMFVIMYDLSDMPANSQTFIRQRTLYMPTNCRDKNLEWGPKWLRYLIHLRFMSSKSGRIYLHSDIRMIIFRKSDLDTATAHGIDMSYELRSFTHMPANPKYSPRK